MKSWMRAACAASVLLATAPWAAPAHAAIADNRFVVFGDSLSDPGNHYVVYHQTSVAPYQPVATAPYDIRGHQFSNGPTWIEQLSRELESPASGLPALASPGVNTNYAVGRARARPGSAVFPAYDLATQVGLFLNDAQGQAPAAPTYVIWIGSNDISDALDALGSDPTGASSVAIVQSAVRSVAGNIQLLWASGARQFLVVNVPDVGMTPALQALGPQASAVATQLSAAYDAGLAQALVQLQALPQVHISSFDAFGYLHAVVANPAAFQLKNVQATCLAFFVALNAVCGNPGQYLFWDGIHPTVAGHELIEEAVERMLRPKDLD